MKADELYAAPSLPVDHFSASSLDMFRRCPVQWRFRYVEDVKIPPGVVAGQGKSKHKVSEHNYRQKIDTHEDLPLDELLDVARDSFKEATEDCDWKQEKVKPAQALDETLAGVDCWRQELAPTVQPVAVEERWKQRDDSWPLPVVGYVDAREEGRIVDEKFIGKSSPALRGMRQDSARDLQSGLYLLTHKLKRFDWHVVFRGAPGTEVIPRAKPEHGRVVAQVANLQRAVIAACDADAFAYAAPGAWWCSEKFCGYWRLCENGGKKRGR